MLRNCQISDIKFSLLKNVKKTGQSIPYSPKHHTNPNRNKLIITIESPLNHNEAPLQGTLFKKLYRMNLKTFAIYDSIQKIVFRACFSTFIPRTNCN